MEPSIAKEVATLLERRLQTAQGAVPCSVEVAEKVDLDQPNHLSGIKNKFIKLSFHNVKALQGAKSLLRPRIGQNKKRIATAAATGGSGGGGSGGGARGSSAGAASRRAAHSSGSSFSSASGAAASSRGAQARVPDDFMDALLDLREHDVKYFIRAQIDNDIRIGAWYVVTPNTAASVAAAAVAESKAKAKAAGGNMGKGFGTKEESSAFVPGTVTLEWQRVSVRVCLSLC